MRQLHWDELRPADVGRIRDWLADRAEHSGVEDLYWVILPDEVLTPAQAADEAARPFCFAVEVGRDNVRFELLIRSRVMMRSPAAGYADAGQVAFILDFADRLLQDLDVET